MAINWKDVQEITLHPWSTYSSSATNKFTKMIDSDGRGIIRGLEVEMLDTHTLKIHKGVCLKDYALIDFIQDITLPLSETIVQQNSWNYVVVKYKYIETQIEDYWWASITVIPHSAYNTNQYLIIADCFVDNNGNITTLNTDPTYIVDVFDHNRSNHLQGGDPVTSQFYHLTRNQWLLVTQILGDNVIDHNTETSGLEGGGQTSGVWHYMHLSVEQFDYLDSLYTYDNGDGTTGFNPDNYLRIDGSGSGSGTATIDSDLDMNNHYIINLHDPSTAQGAATKHYVDTNALLKSGGTMSGDISMGGTHRVTNVLDPINAQDVVTKAYFTTNLNDLIDDSSTDSNHAWSAEKIISWVATHGGSGSGLGGAGISDPLTMTIATNATGSHSLSYDHTQLFLLEPDNLQTNDGTRFVLFKNGKEARVALVGDTLELRRASDLTLAATLVFNADHVSVTLNTNINNPAIEITYFESAVDNTFWDQFLKTDGTNGPTQNINWNGKKVTNMSDPSDAQDAATKHYIDTHALLKSGGTMTGNISMGNSHKITNISSPTNTSDAATKGYVDTKVGSITETDPHSIHLNGSNSPTADVSWGGHKITNLHDPSANQDAATKAYVDSQAGGNITSVNEYIKTKTIPYYDHKLTLTRNNSNTTELNFSGPFSSRTGGLFSVYWIGMTQVYDEGTDCGYGDEGRSVYIQNVHMASIYMVNVSHIYDNASGMISVQFIPVDLAGATYDTVQNSSGSLGVSINSDACANSATTTGYVPFWSRTGYGALMEIGFDGTIGSDSNYIKFRFTDRIIHCLNGANYEGNGFNNCSYIYLKWEPISETVNPFMFYRKVYHAGYTGNYCPAGYTS
jgi:hypothetical protein